MEEKNVLTILENVAKYLKSETTTTLLYKTEATILREQADKIEQKEKDIKEFMDLIEYIKQKGDGSKF